MNDEPPIKTNQVGTVREPFVIGDEMHLKALRRHRVAGDRSFQVVRIRHTCSGCKRIYAGQFKQEVPLGEHVSGYTCPWCGERNKL